MHGGMTRIDIDGSLTEREFSQGYDSENGPTLKIMQEAVGGLLETVPYWDTWEHEDGSVSSCVAFCNEEGKLHKLPVNGLANKWWGDALARNGQTVVDDYLVGPVAVFWGDQEFLESL